MTRTARGAIVALVGAGVLLASVAVGAAAAAALPNPCAVLPSAELVATTGYGSAGLAPRQTRSDADGYPSRICSYRRGATRLLVTVAPASADAGGGFGGLPGLVLRREPSFGAKGLLLYDDRPEYQFVSIAFVSGPYYFILYSKGVAQARILSAGHYVYRHPRGQR